MKILHYIYGLPPVRGGGLVNYALDLVKEEKKLGLDVELLVPGRILVRNSENIKISKEKYCEGIKFFNIINPLPISMTNGITDIEWYTSPYGFKQYKEFLERENPEIIHVHSLMGIHKSFFEAAKHLKIKIIYTSHDYFGICPKTDMMKDHKNCEVSDWRECVKCCRNAFGTTHLILDQSNLFKKFMQLKCSYSLLQKVIKLKAQINVLSENDREQKSDKEIDYEVLRKYYSDIWKLIDIFHFNSDIAANVFSKYLGKQIKKSYVIPITNSNCTDNRKIRVFNKEVRFCFLGNNNIYKGVFLLKEATNKLWREGYKFVLNTYFTAPLLNEEYIVQHEPYKKEQLAEVLNENDVVIVPSILKETFGLVVIEALSHGVPVVVTKNVGAKILLEQTDEMGIICDTSTKGIYDSLKMILDDPMILRYWNSNICKADLLLSMRRHTELLVDLCYKCD